MRWTGDTINLAELAYGIWLTGQINNGQISVTEILECLERVFRVRLGKPHRRWQSIAARKPLGYAKYMDERRWRLRGGWRMSWGGNIQFH
ncbi:RteC domain-containing protein [Mucilaginibacter sp. L3T2-6]|uniref:RteC domain-containing protein n=1 Tax=Mucilaginibacter sp. L3T2-6 TaxID=3062491 RepID=UPI0034A0BD73